MGMRLMMLFTLTMTAATLPARAAPITPSVVDPSSADDATNRPPEVLNAIEQFQQGKMNEAFAGLQTAARRYPHLPPARVMMANLYLTSGQTAAGRQQLERMVAEDPADPEAYLIFGDLMRQQGYFTAAAALYTEATPRIAGFQKDPARRDNLLARLHSGSAAVAEARGQWAEVIAALEKWLAVDADSAAARGRLGRALFFLDRPEEAFAQFQAAAGNDDSGTARPAEISMLLLYHTRGDQQKAAEWKDKALAVSPDNLQTRLGVAGWLWETGDAAAAKTHAEAALAIDATAADALVYCGLAARRLENIDEAERYFQTAYELSPQHLTAGIQLAVLLAGQSDVAKQRRALEIATDIAKSHPHQADVTATLAWAHYRLGRNPEAARSLESLAVGKRPLSRDAAYYVAQVLHGLGRQSEARRLLRATFERAGPFAAEAAARRWGRQIGAATE